MRVHSRLHPHTMPRNDELHSEAVAVRGSWERDPSHFPLPLTPMFASLYLPWQDAALTAMFAEFGYLAGRMRSRMVDGYLYFQVVPVGGWTPPPRMAGALAGLWWLHPALRPRVQRSRDVLHSGHAERILRRWEQEWRPLVERQLHEALRVDLPALADAALLRHFDMLVARTAEYVRIHFVLHGAIAPYLARLEFLCRETPELAGVRSADLLAGLSGRSSEPGRALRGLAEALRGRPNLLREADQRGPDALLPELDRLDPEFASRLRTWLDSYGHRITARYEFIEPGMAEQPERVMALVLSLASRPDDADHEKRLAHRRGTAETAAHAGLHDTHLRRRFDEVLAAARRAYPVRDDNVVLTFNAAFAVVRYTLLEVDRRWQGRMLERPGDAFFLTADELRVGLAGGAAAPDRTLALHAAARRRTWQRQLAASPPPIYLGRPPAVPPLDALPPAAATMNRAIIWYMRGIQAMDGADLSPQPPAPGFIGPARHGEGELEGWGLPQVVPANSSMEHRQASELSPGDRAHAVPPSSPARGGGRGPLRGIPAVGGRYRGTARVIRGEGDFDRLQPGDVLVCPMTSPAWSVLFLGVGALVTDHGGVLSHPAVIAREFGIPAVVATRDATSRIPDGALITVDGDTGTVSLSE